MSDDLKIVIGRTRVNDKIIKDGRQLGGFTQASVVKQIDAAGDAFSFTLPYNKDLIFADGTPIYDVLQPYQPDINNIAEILIGDTRLTRGYIVDVSASSAQGQSEVTLQGVSTSNVITKWSAGWSGGAPGNNGPTYYFSNMSANQIAAIAYLQGSIYYEGNPWVTRARVEDNQSVWDFLSSIAAQFNLWGNPQDNGGLFFSRFSSTRPAVASFVEGQAGVVACSTTHNVSERVAFHCQKKYNSAGGLYHAVVPDPDLQSAGAVHGRKVITPKAVAANGIGAAQNSLSRSIINSYSATLTIAGFARSLTGALIDAGDIIEVQYPSAMIIKKSRFICKRVQYNIDASQKSTTIELALPELFDNKPPTQKPWRS